MKPLLILFALCSLLSAQAPKTKGVLKNITGNTITEDLTFPSGRTLTISAGATINATGATITGFGSGGGASALDDLTDVTITTAATGQVLRYNGSAWVNYTHDFLTATTAASTYATIANLDLKAPLASPTFTGTVTIPSGASITGYLTTAAASAAYQPLNSDLTAISGLTSAADRLTYYTGAGTAALATFTSTARNLLDDSSASAMRSTLGLGTMATQSNGAVSISGGSIQGVSLGVSGISIGSGGIVIEDPLDSGNATQVYGASGASPTLYLPATGTVILSNLSALNGDNISSGTVAAARLGSGSSITTKYLRGDNTWQTISGGGDALTTGTLDQFADVTQTATKTLAITESTTLAGGTHSGTNTGDQTTITGNAGTATALQTGRTINGTTFDGTSNITITAAAGTLTGTTLASNVVTSSLTSLGTIATGVWQGTAIGDSYISSSATWNAKESALTFSTGLTRTTNTITVNTSQNIATLSNLTSNGFVKTSGGTGALSVDTATYLTTTGNGSSLTGLTQSQISGLTTTDRASFANVRPTHSTLTYAGTTDIDLDGNGFQTVTLTGNITFTTSNRAAGRSKTIRIIGDSSLRTFTFPGGWTWVGAAAPASLAANKDAILTITAFGTADTDIIAAYAAEP